MDYENFKSFNEAIVFDMEMFISMSNMEENQEQIEAITQIIAAYAHISIILSARWSKLELPPAIDVNKM